MTRFLMPFAVGLLLAGAVFAGQSNLDWLTLGGNGNAHYNDTYALDILDTAAARVFYIEPAGDVVLAETGGATGDPDFSVAGYAKIAGTLEQDGSLQVDGALTVTSASPAFSNVATAVTFGSASSTTGSKLSIFDGGADNAPGAICFYDDGGVAHWLFVSTAGAFRYHTSYPTDDDTNGVALGTFDTSVDVDLTATGGSTSDGDLTVAGYAEFAGTFEASGASIILGDATGDVITINADTVNLTDGSVITGESIKAVDASGITIFGYAGDADLLQVSDASVERFALTTSASAGALTFTFTDAADSATLVYDHDAAGVFTFNHAVDALGFGASGAIAIGVAADTSQTVTLKDAAGDATLVYNHGAATGELIFNHNLAALEVQTATIGDATDGTNAITIADSGVSTLLFAPVSAGGMVVTSQAVTMATNSFAVSNVKAHVRISPETSNADQLDTITGGTLGQVIFVAPAKEGDTFTITDTSDRTANAIHLSAAFSMEGINDYLVLMFDGLAWAEIGRGNND